MRAQLLAAPALLGLRQKLRQRHRQTGSTLRASIRRTREPADARGFLPIPGQTICGASKAAVKLVTEGLHSELVGTGVRVTVVFPEAVATRITANSGVATPAVGGGNVGRDAKLVDAICRLYPRGAASFIARLMKGLLAQ